MKSLLIWTAVLFALTASAVPSASAQPAHPDRWMGELFDQAPAAMDQSLARFIWPGAHDSGTFGLTPNLACDNCIGASTFLDPLENCHDKLDPSGFGSMCSFFEVGVAAGGLPFGMAQHLSVGQQLSAGVRVLDLRFFRATPADAGRTNGALQPGRFYIHHTFAGPEVTGILSDISAFLSQPGHDKEVIMLRFVFLEEGDDEMSKAGLDALFSQVRNR